MTAPEIRREAIVGLRQAAGVDRPETASDFVPAFLVAVLLVAAGYCLVLAVV